MNKLPKLSFLASHGGSSARQIINALQQHTLKAELGTIISNNSDSAIVHWCNEQQLPIQVVNRKTCPDPADEDAAILSLLQAAATDWVILSGYMKKIGANTLSHYADRILNIHPALLPKHGGQGKYGDYVHAAVLDAGEKVSGATVHLVNDRYDEGPILKQAQVPVLIDDTVASLRARVQSIEAPLYIAAIQELLG
ncbi:MAG: phosphoribosylglycinamide formyltransferase [Methylococcaceae bacterium]|jgi:phosphoribosylglycinamide formyltransferase-1